jgi:hypothetical protein
MTCKHANMFTCYASGMDAPSEPKPSTNLAIKLPADVAELLHRVAYETGRTKRDLVLDAVRQVYGEKDGS